MMQSFQAFVDWFENWRYEVSNNLLKQLIPLIVIMLLLFSGTFLTGCTQNPVPKNVYVDCGTQVGIYNECRG
jgi:hypothetical protein